MGSRVDSCKRIFAWCACAAAAAAVSGQAAVRVYYGFDTGGSYVAMAGLGTSATTVGLTGLWANVTGSGIQHCPVNYNDVFFPPGSTLGVASGAAQGQAGGHARHIVAIPMTNAVDLSAEGTTCYVSFLYRDYNAAPDSEATVAIANGVRQLHFGWRYTDRFGMGLTSATQMLWQGEAGNRFEESSTRPGYTGYFVAAKVVSHAAAPDELYLRVYRTAQDVIGTAEPTNWSVVGTIDSADTFDRLALCMAGKGDYPTVDEIQIASAWSDLFPPALSLAGDGLRVMFNTNGTIRWMLALRSNEWGSVPFRTDGYAGPAWRVEDGGGTRLPTLTVADSNQFLFTGTDGQRSLSLRYQLASNRLAVTAAISNGGAAAWTPIRAGLRWGLNTYMDAYPTWNHRYFPTLLRCEATHFWGYAMTPQGWILGVASPDPVASWHHEYEPAQHRIYTSCFDLLNALPLPARHPQNLTELAPGEQKQWTLHLQDLGELADIKPALADGIAAPMIEASRYAGGPGDPVLLTLWGAPVGAVVRGPGGALQALALASSGTSATATYTLPAAPGLYTVTASNAAGRVAEASLAVRRPWSWYLRQARSEALAKPQKASSHTESWYGFHSMFLARRWLPDAALDAQADAKFHELYPLMYNTNTFLPSSWQSRIQNHSCMAGALADRYEATGDILDLQRAAALCDFLLTRQTEDGAYRSGSSHYTSVVYPGKSIMEVMVHERALGATNGFWHQQYTNHSGSVRRAMDELALNLDNIGTEGQATYEDGMIACSGLQLAQFALLQTNAADRQKYQAAAEHFLRGHRCLDQLLVPDARMNGGTLRFWESQYDILTYPNMMSSPHGWSAWNIYGRWYLYQLTGEVGLLRQAMNALGACVQVIDSGSGELRWAFVADPFVPAHVFTEFPTNQGKGRCIAQTIGEQYLPMIGGWYRAPSNTWVTGYWGGNAGGSGLGSGETWPNTWSGAAWGGDGGSCDNDVHEIFKCLEEVALTSTYLVVNPDGSCETWNGAAARTGGLIHLTPAETLVDRVHVNAPAGATVAVNFGGNLVTREVAGMDWISAPAADDDYHAWRIGQFGSGYATNPLAFDGADPDGDGMSNVNEYRAGSQPTNSASLLRAVGASTDSNGFPVITWDSVGGKAYRIQLGGSGDVGGGFADVAVERVDTNAAGVSGRLSFTDDVTQPGMAAGSNRFYRVRLSP